MIQHHTYLTIADNSGAQEVQCIKIIGGSNKITGSIGDTIIVAIKKIVKKKIKKHEKDKKKIKLGDVCHALIVQTKKNNQRMDGRYINFNKNAAILLNPNGAPIGTRIKTTLSRELRNKNFIKILSLTKKII